jgi:hypothetical protein
MTFLVHDNPVGSVRRPALALAPILFLSAACSSTENENGARVVDGGASGTPGMGGALVGTGGAVAGTGANRNTGSGSNAGGMSNTGGASNTGGGSSTGGNANTGGGANTGGASNDGGTAHTGGGANTGGASNTGGAGSGSCFRAKLLWSEDFESGNYSKWISSSYDDAWGNDCQSNALSTDHALSGTHSQRSQITCAYTAQGGVHRGYGTLQFAGDTPLNVYTGQGTGIDAPYGVVNTFHSWLETPTVFQNGTWFSFWTVNGACDWSDAVLTLGLEDPSNALAAAHYWANAGGTRTYLNGPPGFPRGRWVRTTVYVNYYDEVIHVWQDGVEVSHVTFDRPANHICQWHWGAYASGDNTNVVLYEDDNSIWKLLEPWTDLSVEPHFGASVDVCANP